MVGRAAEDRVVVAAVRSSSLHDECGGFSKEATKETDSWSLALIAAELDWLVGYFRLAVAALVSATMNRW